MQERIWIRVDVLGGVGVHNEVIVWWYISDGGA